VDRRGFVAGTIALLAAPLGATASAQEYKAQQSGRTYKIGYLGLGAGPASTTRAFRDELRERGWIEGQNISIEYRWLASSTQGPGALAQELLRFGIDVLLTAGNKAVAEVQKATSSVPIVMAWSNDPVGSGLVASMRRPGGNVTGLTWDAGLEIGGKRLELLKQASPGFARVLNLWDPADPGVARYWPGVTQAANALGLGADSAEIRTPGDLQAALDRARESQAALFIWAGQLLIPHIGQICRFALRHRLPTLSMATEHVSKDGCLMSYSPNADDVYRRAAIYVDRILRGAQPADLPIEQPSKFELAINVRTARALGLTIPQSLLLRADQVIDP
jgi:ABC-type uncharacterized transport system substrate-binding protein